MRVGLNPDLDRERDRLMTLDQHEIIVGHEVSDAVFERLEVCLYRLSEHPLRGIVCKHRSTASIESIAIFALAVDLHAMNKFDDAGRPSDLREGSDETLDERRLTGTAVTADTDDGPMIREHGFTPARHRASS